jgi:hypothetical protein
MLLKAFGKNNYIIDNNVIGLVTAKLMQQNVEEALETISKKNQPFLEVTQENGVIIIKPKSESDTKSTWESMMKIIEKSKMPVVEGITCRMSGYLILEHTSMAILETGTPPDSDLSIVELDKQVNIQGKTYQVAKITSRGLVLRCAPKTLTVPFAPLIPTPPKS